MRGVASESNLFFQLAASLLAFTNCFCNSALLSCSSSIDSCALAKSASACFSLEIASSLPYRRHEYIRVMSNIIIHILIVSCILCFHSPIPAWCHPTVTVSHSLLWSGSLFCFLPFLVV